jgi:hypothetical protein
MKFHFDLFNLSLNPNETYREINPRLPHIFYVRNFEQDKIITHKVIRHKKKRWNCGKGKKGKLERNYIFFGRFFELIWQRPPLLNQISSASSKLKT